MKCKIVQSIGIINILIGIAGTAGAIERDTGLGRSVALMAAGSFIVFVDRLIRSRQ